MGTLEQIWIKRSSDGPMDAVDSAELVSHRGIIGNANQGGHRQVTIIERELWDAMMPELESDLPGSTRRANLVVSGLSLLESRGGAYGVITRGGRLEVGDSVSVS